MTSPALAEWLRYLHEMGWEELLSRPASAEAGAVAHPGGSTATTHCADRTRSEASGEALADAAPRLLALAEEASTCRACSLCERRNSVVFGDGPVDADLMVVGEGPGAEEDRRGLPFVGPAGELLTKILSAIDLRRDQVYIANVVKCRPPGNRDPRPDEVTACRRYLEGQIEIIQPRILLVVGRVAAQCLLDTDSSLSGLRGRWHECRGVPVRVTYHPAALLRNASFKRPTWEDVQIVRDQLSELRQDA